MSKKRAHLRFHVIPHDHFGDDIPVLLNIPQMQKPFDYGWQREIVYQHVGYSRNSEVVYITPCGKKLSCRSDVDKYLKTEKIGYLSPDWFSFDNHVLVGGGDKEVSCILSVAPAQSEPWRKSKWSTVVICTRYCPDRNNSRPSLQCNMCKAFFHPECVFLSPTEAKKVKDYVCTHCLLEQNPDALKVKIKLTDVSPVLKLSFDCLLHILSYLPLRDLCSASCVCSMWNQVSSQPILWRRVSLHGLQVKNWDFAARPMVQFSTQRLDLRGLLHGKSLTDSWSMIGNVLHQLTSLKWLDFGLVPTWILHRVTESSPDLEVLTAEWISDTEQEKWAASTSHLDFGKIAHLTSLRRLQLRAACGGLTIPTFTFSGGLMALSNLKNLTKLSLTTLKNVPSSEFGFLRDLPNLEALEVGECSDWDDETYECLGYLTNLKCLRLECGSSHDGLAQALKRMHRLVHLDLIMFGIPPTLADVLQLLPSLKTLSICRPVEDSAVNSHWLDAVCNLSDLYCLDWGVLTGPQASIITDWHSCDSPSSDVLSKDEPLMPIAPDLCSNLASEFKLHKDLNNNSTLSLNELSRILCNRLPMTDVRVFRVPVMHASRLYFTI